MHDSEETARRVLALNTAVLEDLANSLVRAETLSGPSLDVYMEAVNTWPEPILGNNGQRPPIQLRPETVDALDAAAGDTEWDDEPSGG
jgi:hypothetical protein